MRAKLLISLAISAIPSMAFAQSAQNSGLSSLVEQIYSWSIGVGIALAVIMMMYAGYVMVTSAGVPDQVGKAKEMIVGALSGVALLAAAGLILHLLSTDVSVKEQTPSIQPTTFDRVPNEVDQNQQTA